MRVDKWIWAVRMVKSRTLAGQFCKQGKVEINGKKAKPASSIKLEDIVSVDHGSIEKQYKVTGFIPKRVSAEKAALNYEDLTPEAVNEEFPSNKYAPRRERGEGRPTKKDWRDIQRTKEDY